MAKQRHILEKLTRSVDEERVSKPAEEELLYAIQRARRRQPDHRKPFLSFWHVANTMFSPAMSLIPRFFSVHLWLFDKATADNSRLIGP